MGAVFREVEQLVARHEEVHFRRRFAVRRHLEFERDPVDRARVAGRLDEVVRAHQGYRAERDGLAEATVDVSALALGEKMSELIVRAPVHGGAGDDVLRDGVLHVQVRGNDRDFSACDLLVGDNAADAAPMVAVRMRDDDTGDGALAAMLDIKLNRRPRAFDRGEAVDDDHALVALDQRHVRQIETPHLIDARNHLEQSVVHVELRLPPQAWVDRVRRLACGKEAVRLQAPDDPSLVVDDMRVLARSKKSAGGIGEVGPVRERQFCDGCGMSCTNGSCGIVRLFDLSVHADLLPRKFECRNSGRAGAQAAGTGPGSGLQELPDRTAL